ncbi:MAG: 50S ribosomal protein L11 methyltransferase [Pseudomonadota bacterium]
MTTWTALTTLADEGPARALAAQMEELLDPTPTGIGCFEIEDGSGRWEVGGYFTEMPDEAGLALLAVMHGARPFAVSKLADRDWVAQVRRELHPIETGRFVVHGAHDAHRVGPNVHALAIEAAMAFGTGHHATTQGCLWLIDRMARANAAANGLGGFVRALTAPGFRHERLRREAAYDLVLANILAAPLKRLAPEVHRHLAPGGRAILSGLLTTQAPGVLAVYQSQGFRRVERRCIGEWTSLLLEKC